jgi:lipid II:glycine glycyltransferase (peptidoglycan interpeptide bridge formation enzyme)
MSAPDAAAGTLVPSRGSQAPPVVVRDERSAPEGWDARAVQVRGGHVMQSVAWADYRRSLGAEPRFLSFDDGRAVLATLRRTPGLPGVEAVVRRGPAHLDEPATTAAARAAGLAAWAREQGARDLFLDPERPADRTWEDAMDAAGFRVSEGLEPSIHVMRLDFEPDMEEEMLFARLSKSTRQRVRAAEREGTSVLDDRAGERLEELVVLMRERADALGIPLRADSDYLRGWRALLGAGLARLLLADHDGQLVGGLFLYRQGGLHATAYSADKADSRTDLPGTMHLLRWTAIRDALREGASAIELGGVDLPGQRRPPRPGEPGYGLFEHKRGFGAIWLERTPARRIVLRPAAERLARSRRRVIDAWRGMRR